MNHSNESPLDSSRRGFLESLAAVTALSLTSSPLDWLRNAAASSSLPTRLSWLAHRGTDFEGSWSPTEIEGALPPSLLGTLYRIGPGSKNTQGTPLNHFFDGDALITALRIESGRVTVRSRFVNTPERIREKSAGRMLYNDYGTESPARPHGYKNSPNIHVLPWAGKLLALSEATHPVALDARTLETEGTYNFEGTLSRHVSFTAHPKLDPGTGDTYSFGISKSPMPSLKVFRMNPKSGRIQKLHSIRLGGYYPVHDMMMTENYLVFVVSALRINLAKAALTLGTVAEILDYDESQPLRIIVVRKDGNGEPIEIKSAPGGLIFHHCNAYEDGSNGRIVFHSMLMEDASAFTLFQAWSAARPPRAPLSWITRFEIDLSQKTVISREALSDGTPTDFPCIDPRRIGTPLKTLHALESDLTSADQLAFHTIASWDLSSGKARRFRCDQGQTLGEILFVPEASNNQRSADAGWLLHLGYDSRRDETYLDVRRPITLDLRARVWLGRYVPLGFHGCFKFAD